MNPANASRRIMRVDLITERLHISNRMVTNKRNPDRTRRAILDAAAAEFGAAGPAGARIDAIAAAAGVNKRMLYHYFANKEGLFAAVLDDRLGGDPVGASAPSLVDRQAIASGRADQVRLLMWEALTGEMRRVDPLRAAPWRARVAGLEAAQHAGRHSWLDPAQLELTYAAIVLFPLAFPQLTQLITGMSPADATFVAARSAFLAAFESRLARQTETEPSKPRYRLAASVTELPPLRGE
jgi:AcrR family transcriptional regulator